MLLFHVESLAGPNGLKIALLVFSSKDGTRRYEFSIPVPPGGIEASALKAALFQAAEEMPEF